MSYDLAVWHSHKPLRRNAAKIYSAISGSTRFGLKASPRVAAFYADLTAIYPELDDATQSDIERCPWTAANEHTDSYVVMCVAHSQAQKVIHNVVTLVEKHKLSLYDPQKETLFYSPGNLSYIRWRLLVLLWLVAVPVFLLELLFLQK